MKFITRTVVVLSFVSLLTDIASEMLYPIMPMYLTSIGFSVALIGLLEGMAEAMAGFSKGYFGHLSDTRGIRKPFIQSGYSLSAVSKPLMAVMTFPLWIFGVRTLDRLGKGIRTGARDALLSAETTAEYKGRVFGFHRAFDTIGAALGPSAALIFLIFYPGEYRILFLLAFFPGVFAIILTFFVNEKKILSVAEETWTTKPGFFAFLQYWKTASREFRLLVAGLLFFTLMNSSDVILLLMLRHHGASDQQVIGVYIFYNLVYALMSYPMGALGDKIGLKATFMVGLLLFSIVYGGIIAAASLPVVLLLFFLYGIYAASTEGISKAWISNIVPKSEVATAIGFYTGMQSFSTLLASSLAGWLWYTFSPEVPFFVSAGGALLTLIYLFVVFVFKGQTVFEKKKELI